MLASKGGSASTAATTSGLTIGTATLVASTAPSCAAPVDLSKYLGRSTGTGQCVALVQSAQPSLGRTRTWSCGDKVQGNTTLAPGTPIATFDRSQRYANATDGSSHAAIYLGQDAHGLQVMDQWAGSKASIRTILWNNPSGVAANTGAAFHVIKTT
ncbi:MAG: hypothetical protein NVSMB18_17900 [Acetobacteraceae bacterium]